MFTKNVFVVLGFVIVFCSCGGSERDELTEKFLGEQLEEANMKISFASKMIGLKLAEEYADTNRYYRTANWQSKSKAYRDESIKICMYIDSLKNKSNIDWDKTMLHLKQCEEKFKSIDLEVKQEFGNKINKIAIIFDTTIDSKNNLTSVLNNLSINSRNALLSKIKNTILNMEYDVLRYLENINSPGCNLVKFDYYNILVGQSTTHLKKGDVLEISAGVGNYARATKPSITIDGKNVEAFDAVGTLKKKIVGKIGKYFIPVKIEFTDENGIHQKRTETVEYTIDP
jgi:hypothetical protein